MYIFFSQMLHKFGPTAAVLHVLLNGLARNKFTFGKGISCHISRFMTDYIIYVQAFWKSREGQISVNSF